jgi:hypothetical protein
VLRVNKNQPLCQRQAVVTYVVVHVGYRILDAMRRSTSRRRTLQGGSLEKSSTVRINTLLSSTDQFADRRYRSERPVDDHPQSRNPRFSSRGGANMIVNIATEMMIMFGNFSSRGERAIGSEIACPPLHRAEVDSDEPFHRSKKL